MAVKYLDAKRIRGESANSSSSWTSNHADWTYSSSGYLDFSFIRRSTTSQEIYLDLQDFLGGSNLSDTSWVVRLGKFTVNSLASSGNVQLLIGLTNSSGADTGESQQTIAVKYNFNPSAPSINVIATANTIESGDVTETVYSSLAVTDYYIEIKRDGNDFTVTAYSDEYNTMYSSATDTVTKSGISGLRYLKAFTYSDQEQSGYTGAAAKLYGDVQIYNGQTSATTLTKTIKLLDEKETLITYIVASSPDFTDIYDATSASGWTTNAGSGITINNHISGKLSANAIPDNSANRVTKALGLTLSDTSWVAQFEFMRTSGANAHYPFMVAAGTGQIWNANQDHIGIEMNGTGMQIKQRDGTSSTGGTTIAISADTQYFCTIIRNTADLITFEVRTVSHTGSHVSGSPQTLATSSSTSGFTTLHHSGRADGGGGSSSSWQVDNVNIYDGITAAVSASSSSDLPENTIFEETDTYKTYWLQDVIWKDKSWLVPILRGFASGGSSSSGASNVIDMQTIATGADATLFGNLITSREGSGACADATRCLDAASGSIEYWTAASNPTVTAGDFGDLSVSRNPQGGGFADATRGCFAGGSNVIDFVTIQSSPTVTAGDFGDLQGAYQQTSACADATRGLIAGGWTGSNVDSIDYVTIQSAGDAGDFGNLLSGRYALAATSDATRGLIAGGQSSANVIEYVTIQTRANSDDFGDLTRNVHKHTAYADRTKACFAGGANGGRQTTIDYVTIQTEGNASPFGDLTVAREVTGGCAV